jgi:hypothetical protein
MICIMPQNVRMREYRIYETRLDTPAEGLRKVLSEARLGKPGQTKLLSVIVSSWTQASGTIFNFPHWLGLHL